MLAIFGLNSTENHHFQPRDLDRDYEVGPLLNACFSVSIVVGNLRFTK